MFAFSFLSRKTREILQIVLAAYSDAMQVRRGCSSAENPNQYHRFSFQHGFLPCHILTLPPISRSIYKRYSEVFFIKNRYDCRFEEVILKDLNSLACHRRRVFRRTCHFRFLCSHFWRLAEGSLCYFKMECSLTR